MRRWSVMGVVVLMFALPAKSWAWGCVGHQVVAYIASQNLNPVAAAKVKDLLSNATYGFPRFCSPTTLGNIEKFATWADDARTDANAGWHFWDIPLALDTASMPAYCAAGCVVQAIQTQVATLTSATSTRADQQTALKFLIHLVGDAHQPMHIVDNGDRGGNCVPVTFKFTGQTHATKEAKDKNGNPDGSYSPNLHSIWDDNVISTMTGVENKTNHDALTKKFADSIVTEYAATIGSEKTKTVDFTTAVESWAVAAHELAKPKSYDAMPVAIPVDPSPHTLTGCEGVSSQFVGLNEVAQGKFITDAQPVIKQQLALAGGRLAAALNTIWPASK
jgi:hypothetical protein